MVAVALFVLTSVWEHWTAGGVCSDADGACGVGGVGGVMGLMAMVDEKRAEGELCPPSPP